jgi:cystathionine beta-lyase/cystathionine gamma-synthase
MNFNELSIDTGLLYSGGIVSGDTLHPESPPLYSTSAFVMEDLTQLRETDARGGYSYGRGTNPTRDALSEAVSAAEKGEKTLSFSAGMGAIGTTLLTFAKSGSHVIANKDLYGETIDFLTNYLSKFGVETSFVNFQDPQTIKNAMRPNTVLLYSEVISNPLTYVINVAEIAKIAHEGGALLCIDSTFTTPFVLRPLEHGADICIHSLTKYYNGHSDTFGGSVTARKELTAQIRPMMLLLGNSIEPHSAWMILRGMRTMPLRVRRQMENANKLAAFLSRNSHVLRVNHPSLEIHPQHQLAAKQFLDGYNGAIMSFSVADDFSLLDKFMHELRFVKYLPTLGGYRTTLSHPVSSSHQDVPEPIRLKMGIHDGMMRISVGTEDINDLLEDFDRALKVF